MTSELGERTLQGLGSGEGWALQGLEASSLKWCQSIGLQAGVEAGANYLPAYGTCLTYSHKHYAERWYKLFLSFPLKSYYHVGREGPSQPKTGANGYVRVFQSSSSREISVALLPTRWVFTMHTHTLPSHGSHTWKALKYLNIFKLNLIL